MGRVCGFSPHVLIHGVFLTPCTGVWCVPHPMYWCMVCSSSHVLVCGVFLTPCTGLWCVPHPMYWSVVCSSPHVLVYGVFLTPCTGLWCVPHPMYWSMVCSLSHVLVYGVSNAFNAPEVRSMFPTLHLQLQLLPLHQKLHPHQESLHSLHPRY